MGEGSGSRLGAGEAFGQKPRELAPWQVVAIGGLAGALASIVTTPADVVKTRIMTASASQGVSSGACEVSRPGTTTALILLSVHRTMCLRLCSSADVQAACRAQCVVAMQNDWLISQEATLCNTLCRAHHLADPGNGGRRRAVQGRAAAGVLGCAPRRDQFCGL